MKTGKIFHRSFFLVCIIFSSHWLFVSSVTPKIEDANAAVVKVDSLKSRITGFLTWYKINLHPANSFALLTKDSLGYAKVDAKECNNFLSFLNKSGFIADQYIRYWSAYFKDREAMIKEEKLESDIPDGFDMDFVLLTQEPEYILNNINKLRFKIISRDDQLVVVGMKLPGDSSVDYEFDMYKIKGKWQIGYISTSNYD